MYSGIFSHWCGDLLKSPATIIKASWYLSLRTSFLFIYFCYLAEKKLFEFYEL